jgi:AcrR family transcriptional regulator
VDALIKLHEEVGPSRTTVSAVAAEAGVERLTVYRHFPDEQAMLSACSSRWEERNPLPAIPDAATPAHVRRALLALYAWYRRNARMLTQLAADADRVPFIRDNAAQVAQYLDALASALERAWPRRRAHRRATLRHALEFSTWRSLAQLAGSDAKAAAIVLGWLDIK